MAAPVNREEFFDLVRKSGVLDPERLDTFARSLTDSGTALDQPQELAQRMVRDGLLTTFQAKQLLQGKWRRFMITGKYKLLEILGVGGMGAVYLCEHIFMRRLVAIKVLPFDKVSDPSSLERFYREARAAGALDHPNIVRAYDIDQEANLHFLVMEYVDGSSLQEIVARRGPMDPVRAAHYVRQAALGLEHAHAAGLVHRDIKPGNLLLDRAGTVKLLDLGLARFFNAHKDNVTEKYDDKAILGTADYLAPEQAMGSAVDIRADVYSLGGTFYFLLTGKAPFEDGTVTQKLLWHQTRRPQSVREQRPEVPEGMVPVLEKMLAKDPADRFQTPKQVVEALSPWTQAPLPPPPESEMPRRSPAALAPGAQGYAPTSLTTPPPRAVPSTVQNQRSPGASTVTSRSAPSTPVSPLPQRTGPMSRPAVASSEGFEVVEDETVTAVEEAPARTGRRRKAHRPAPAASRKMLLAGVGGAVVVVVLGGALLWALSGRDDATSGIRPVDAKPPPAESAHKVETPALPNKVIVAVIPPEKAGEYIQERCTVEMTVRYVGKATTADRWFLNSKEDYRDRSNFTVTFTKPVLDALKARGVENVSSFFTSRTIRVTGTITEYGNRPQMEIENADQIQILDPNQ